SAKLPLEKTLAHVVAGIRNHYVETLERREGEAIESARRHAEWLKRTEEWERKEEIRLQQEKQRKHAEALASAVQARKTALLEAADNWQQSNTLLEFIEACEARWKNQLGGPPAEHIGWLTWAR